MPSISMPFTPFKTNTENKKLKQLIDNLPDATTFAEDEKYYQTYKDTFLSTYGEFIGQNQSVINQIREKVPYTCYKLLANGTDDLVHIFGKYKIMTITDIELFLHVVNIGISIIFSPPKPAEKTKPTHVLKKDLTLEDRYSEFLQQYIYLLKQKKLTNDPDRVITWWTNTLYKIVTYYHSFMYIHKCNKAKSLTKEFISIFLQLMIEHHITFANMYSTYYFRNNYKHANYYNNDLLQSHVYIVIPTILQLLTENDTTIGTSNSTQTNQDQINLCKWIDQILSFIPNEDIEDILCNNDQINISTLNMQLKTMKEDLINILKQYPSKSKSKSKSIYDLYQSVHSLTLIT